MDIKSLAAKSTIGLVGLSGLGAGGYYGINALNGSTEVQKTIDSKSSSLSDQLKKEKYVPIAAGNSHIATILINYKGAESTQQNLKFTGFDGNPVGTKKAEDILLEKCNGILNNETASEQDQKIAKKWCVEPTNVSDLLGKRGISPLNSSNETHNEDWKNKIKEYRDSIKSKIDTLSFTKKTEEPSEDEIRQIKEKCNSIGAKKNHEDKFEETLSLFATWCSK